MRTYIKSFLSFWLDHSHMSIAEHLKNTKKYNKNQNPIILPPRQISINSLMHFLSVLCLGVCVYSFSGLFQGCVVSSLCPPVPAPIPQGFHYYCSTTDFVLMAQTLHRHFCFNMSKIILNYFSFS